MPASLSEIVDSILDINIGIFMGKTKKQVLLRRRKLLLIRLLKHNKKMLAIMKGDKDLQSESDRIKKIIEEIEKELEVNDEK